MKRKGGPERKKERAKPISSLLYASFLKPMKREGEKKKKEKRRRFLYRLFFPFLPQFVGGKEGKGGEEKVRGKKGGNDAAMPDCLYIVLDGF